MRRRRFVTGLLSISALALASPGLRAQQPARPKRVAVLMPHTDQDSGIVVPATTIARADEVLE